jgi:hypothetical protein
VRVVVVRNVAHVIIDGPGGVHELVVRYLGKDLMEVTLNVVGRHRVMYAPHDHRNETDFAVANPTGLVFEVALGEDGRLTELATVAH